MALYIKAYRWLTPRTVSVLKTALLWAIMQRAARSGSCPLKMRPIVCPDTSVMNYHYTMRNSPEERGFHLLRGRSLISRIVRLFLQDIWCIRRALLGLFRVITFIRLFSHIYTVFPSGPWPLRRHQSQSITAEQVSVIAWAYFATALSVVICSVNNWLWPSRDHNYTRSNHVSATDTVSRRSELLLQTSPPYTQSIRAYCE